MGIRRRIKAWRVCLLLIVIIVAKYQPLMSAAQASRWTQIDTPFDEDLQYLADMLFDRTGRGHLFWHSILAQEEMNVIRYASMNPDGTWTPSSDVTLISSGAFISITITSIGRLHLLVRDESCLKYLRSKVRIPQGTRDWEEMGCVGLQGSYEKAMIQADSNDRLHVAYASNLESINYKYSNNEGNDWSQVKIAYISEFPRAIFPENPCMTIDNKGTVHLAWNVLAFGEYVENPGDYYGIYYTNISKDGTLSDIKRFSDRKDVLPNILSTSEGEIHIAWLASLAGGAKRYHRVSYDYGQTWSKEYIFDVPSGGIMQHPGMILDATNTLHLGLPTDSGAYYTQWRNGKWTDPSLITGRSDVMESFVRFGIQYGNRLYVYVDVGGWFGVREIEAPYQPPGLPYPDFSQFTPTPTPPTPTLRPLPSETPLWAPTFEPGEEPESPVVNMRERQDNLLIIALVPFVVLFLSVLAVTLVRRGR